MSAENAANSRRYARWPARVLHALKADSHQHRFLTKVCDAIRLETVGEVDITVIADNGGFKAFDPLERLVEGEIEFFTIMGNGLGKLVPAAEIQGVPFAFADSAAVHRANDGELGAHLTRECAAKGIYRFRRGLMENGFRHVSTYNKPIQSVADLVGLKIRVPHARMVEDVIASFGAVPMPLGIEDLPASLRERKIDGHENPLISFEAHNSIEVTPYISLTAHMWTGFNILSSMQFWKRLPEQVQTIIDRHVTRYANEQRSWAQNRNRELETQFAARGAFVSSVDRASLKGRLEPAFYRRWRAELGSKTWDLLEAEVGPLPR